MTELGERLVQAALGGPAVAGVAWLALVRWPWIRRAVAGLVALAAHAAAWGVFWLRYGGDPASWRSFAPGLLGATLAVAAEVAVLLVALRVEWVGRRGGPTAVVGLAVSASALVGAAYAVSLPVQVLLVAVPTVAAAAAALADRGRIDLAGLIGLAAADVVAAAGFTVAQVRGDATAMGSSAGAAAFLILIAGAAKAGALPGIATWRLARQDGPGGLVAAALRAQGVVLAAIGGLTLGGARPSAAVAGVAAGAVLLAGLWAARARTRTTALTAATGAAAGVPFLALGLGGAVGIRAFLVLFPALLVAIGAAVLLAWPGRTAEARPPRAGWRWLGTASLGVAVLSLVGFPPGGGFPGTWLTLSLAGVRSEGQPWWLLALGAAALGLALAALGAVALIRSAGPGAFPAVAGVLAAAALLYIGAQPVRLGVGWWVRVEAELRAPVVLAASGAPDLPPLGGLNLALVIGEGLAIVGLIVLLGRGFRDARVPFTAVVGGAVPAPGRRLGALVARPLRGPIRALAGARARGLDLGVVVVLELAALVLAARVVLVAADSGFL
jgi:hypothetical protein